jgi:hypothetical protein
MKKIISYSLWGDNPKYIIGAKRNLDLALEYFPDWIVRIYLSTNTIFDYTSPNLEIVFKTETQSQDGCFWRFEACDSDDIVIVRDLDDRLSNRHKFVVDEWLSSDKNLHIIKDHPNHTFPIMAGLWGSRNGILKGITKYISDWSDKNFYTTDQEFLRRLLLNSKFLNDSFIHDPYHRPFGIERSINVDRKDYEFLGDTFDENDNRLELYWKIIQQTGK